MKDRHPAWQPSAGFPELPMQADSEGKMKYIFDEAVHTALFKDLRIYVIRTCSESGERKYYPAFSLKRFCSTEWEC